MELFRFILFIILYFCAWSEYHLSCNEIFETVAVKTREKKTEILFVSCCLAFSESTFLNNFFSSTSTSSIVLEKKLNEKEWQNEISAQHHNYYDRYSFLSIFIYQTAATIHIYISKFIFRSFVLFYPFRPLGSLNFIRFSPFGFFSGCSLQ